MREHGKYIELYCCHGDLRGACDFSNDSKGDGAIIA
jgi:hypothetical protein